jgi:hypothetical protein
MKNSCRQIIIVYLTNPSNMNKLLLFLIAFNFHLLTRAQCLSGTYTIGGSNSNFQTFETAVSALLANGICGPVNFQVSDGVYPENFNIPAVTGSSKLNTITFEGASKDSMAVIIDNPTFNGSFIGSSNIIIKHIGFVKKGIQIDQSVENIAILNCYFKTKSTVSIYGSFSSDYPQLTISANYFISDNATAAISMYLPKASGQGILKQGITISKNTLNDFSKSIIVSGGDSLNISGNTIQSITPAVNAIEARQLFNFLIVKNKIKGSFASAIDLSSIQFTSCERTIKNNFIHNKGRYGITLNDVHLCGFIFNTINVIGNNDGAVINMQYSDYNTYKNNILNSAGKNLIFKSLGRFSNN